MEPVLGAFLGDEWDALCKMFTSEDSDLLLQLNGDYDHALPSNESSPNLCFQNQSLFFPINEGNQNVGRLDGSFQGFNVLEYLNFHNVSQENSNSSESGSQSQSQSQSPYLHYESNQIHEFCELLKEPNHGMLIDESNAKMVASFLDCATQGMMISPRDDVGSEKLGNADGQQSSIDDSCDRHILKRKLDNAEVPVEVGEKCIAPSPEIPTKKPRAPRNAQKSKTKAQSKPKKGVIKGKQVSNVDEEETNGVQIGEVSSYSNSEDDSNASQESNGGSTSDSKEVAINTNGKTRASRGSATDPQSLYARKRRERINERLRILQNLIPNGTKVDISTMLEEAVHYVKFMQLQIKLLSSDDMWMYAPIVYNGIDVGMYNKIFPTL